MKRSAITDARARRNDLTDALRTMRKEIRAEERRDAERAAGTARDVEVTDKNCTPRCRDTAIVIYMRVPDSGKAAQTFLEASLGRKLGVPVSAARFMNVVRERSTTTNMNDEATTAWWTRRKSDADKYLREKDLVQWIDEQNRGRGVAPTTRAVYTQRTQASACESVATAAHDVPLHAALPPRRKKWMRRFMRRWALRRGTLPSGTGMTTEEAARKVPGGRDPTFAPPEAAQKSPPGPILRAPFGGQKMATILGPRIHSTTWGVAGFRPQNRARQIVPQTTAFPENTRQRPCGSGRIFWSTPCRRTKRPSSSISTRVRAASGPRRSQDYSVPEHTSK